MSLPGNLDFALGESGHRLRIQNHLEGALHARCVILKGWANAFTVEVGADKFGSERGGVVRSKIREGLLEVGFELGLVLGDGWGGVGHCRVRMWNSGRCVRMCFISTLFIRCYMPSKFRACGASQFRVAIFVPFDLSREWIQSCNYKDNHLLVNIICSFRFICVHSIAVQRNVNSGFL